MKKRNVKTFWFFLALMLVAVVTMSGCVNVGEKESGYCKTNRDDFKCTASYSNGEIKLSLSPAISGAFLGKAYLSTCEITGSLWSCRGRVDCEIISSQQPFRVKCPVTSGAYATTFKLMKTVDENKMSTEQFISNCQSTPEGKFNCELVIEPTYYFKV